jgi:CheY-like chemotaxis protein
MSETAVILLVEDRDDDIVLAEKALKRAFVTNPLRVVKDGSEAISYLSGQGRYSSRIEYPLPSLILLDLKLPGLDGFEVLKWIREQPQTRTIPVVVLTSSDQIRDVNRAYALGANSFLVKPLDFEQYIGLGKFLREHWIKSGASQTLAHEMKGPLPEAFRPRIVEGPPPAV